MRAILMLNLIPVCVGKIQRCKGRLKIWPYKIKCIVLYTINVKTATMRIPAEVKEFMKECGLNTAEAVGDGLYLLSSIAEDGSIAPTGLPMIVEFHMGKLRELPTSEAFKVLRKS